MNAALDTTLGLQTANLVETKVCVNKKLSCFTFEHLCGPQKLLNFREMLKYFLDLTKNLPGPWQTAHSVVNILLEGKKVEFFLALIQPLCPDSSKHCKKENREKRSLPSMEIDVLLDGGHERRIRKRALDPLEVMDLFNKMLCNEEMIVAFAEYYHENHRTRYNPVWPIKNIAFVWCCLAENLEMLYHKTPDK